MKQIVIFLFSKSSIIAKPWAAAGVECHLFDLASDTRREGLCFYWGGDLKKRLAQIGDLIKNNECLFVGSFTPCTDVAVSGSRHFDTKAKQDAYVWAKSVHLAVIGPIIADIFRVPYFVENPKSMLSTLWRKPDFKFNPWMFGGHLEKGHQHALYPEIYPGQDAYKKETWIWCGNGFVIPEKMPVMPVENDYPGFSKLGGKSDRTKEIRSVTPEGFAIALFKSNYSPTPLNSNS